MHTTFHMLWGAGKHVAFAYLVYSLLGHSRGKSPRGTEVAVLFFGVMFPDIVDKLLVWLGVLDYGRSFAHSLITASVIIGIVRLLAQEVDELELGNTFGLGYLLHLPVDLYGPLLTGHNPVDTAFLFWPLLIEHPLGVMPPPIPVARNTVFTVVLIVAFLLWVYDGLPLLDEVFEYARRSATDSKL